MEVFLQINISEKTIELLENNFSNSEKNEIIDCIEYIFNSIRYLRKLEVNNDIIEKILITNHHFLILGNEEIEKFVNRIGVDTFVNNLNNNYMYIENI